MPRGRFLNRPAGRFEVTKTKRASDGGAATTPAAG